MSTADGSIEPIPAAPQPHRRRRWWSLSVRGLMLLVLLIGGAIGWEANRVSRMRRAIAVLTRPSAVPKPDPADLSGPPFGSSLNLSTEVEILFDDEYADGEFQTRSRWSWLPAWVRRAVGEDHFRQVTWLKFGRRPTPADWDAIATLGSVETVGFRTSGMSDADLVGIERCSSLREFSFDFDPEAQITGKALTKIAALPHLRSLQLAFTTSITLADLTAIENLKDLESLTLSSMTGTDAALIHLRKLANLREIQLGPVSDRGLAELLATHPRLENLTFEPWDITDAGFATLARFPALKRLEIKKGISALIAASKNGSSHPTRITPAGLTALRTMRGLESLGLLISDLVDDAWLISIGQLTGLRSLKLDGDRISNVGLAALRRLVNLETLNVRSQEITQAGLDSLTAMKALTDLSLSTAVDPEKEVAIRAALPKLRRVSFDSNLPAGP